MTEKTIKNKGAVYSLCVGHFAFLQTQQCDQKQMKSNGGEKKKEAEVLIGGGVRYGGECEEKREESKIWQK